MNINHDVIDDCFANFCSVNANKILRIATNHTSELLVVKNRNLITITGKLITKYEVASNDGWLFNIEDDAKLFSDNNMQVVYLPKYSGGYTQVAFKRTLDSGSNNVIQCSTAYSGNAIKSGEEISIIITLATQS